MAFQGPAGAKKAPIEAYPCGSDWFDQLSNGTSREWGGVPQAAVDGSSPFFAESSFQKVRKRDVQSLIVQHASVVANRHRNGRPWRLWG
jgi:hypothetical protein